MERKDDFEKLDKAPLSNKIIPGQVCYDELLSKAQPKEEEKPAEKIDGQIDFSDLLKSLDERLITSSRIIERESKPRRSVVNQSENIDANPIVNETIDLEQTAKIVENNDKPITIKPKPQKVETIMERTNLKLDDEEMIEEINEEIIEDASDDDSSIQPPTSSNGSYKDGLIEMTLDEVLHNSMIPYTEHVVLDRALPRVEDGLKPVQRRILYSMMELGVTPDKQFRKSARIVGDCMGKYHPHGDSSVYDAMVRMSQDFSMSAPLVWGHGNFGSVDGDSAAAMRYTEAKLQPLAMELLRDLDKNTVKWSLNFDDTLKEPDMLPGRFPNLLVNGAYGIAVGLATNIPPHNLGEVIDGVVAYIDNPKISLEDMMKHIKAPDFPTGAYITAGEEVYNAYKTGKGKLIIRSKVHLETKGDKRELVITEIPYQVNKAQLLQKIVELKNDSKNPLADISEIRDESDRNGMRACIRLKKEANPKQILEFLYKNTQLQTSFGINMVAIADGKPRQMGLIDIISYYVEYQREVIVRRTKYDLDTAKDRAHIIEGLLIAIKNIDEVIKIIKKSTTPSDAKQKLRERFLLSDKQAQAILDMRLGRLVNLEVEKLEKELIALRELIKELTNIMNSKKLQYNVVKTEILDIKRKYSVDRRSEIINSLEIKNLKSEDEAIVAKTIIVAATAENTIKNMPAKHYSMAQKEITDASTKNDVHTVLIETKSDKKVLIITNSGYALKIDAMKIPESKWRDKGVTLKQLDNNANPNDSIVAILELPPSVEGKKLLFLTRLGLVKVSEYSEYIINKSYFQAIKLKSGDEVISCQVMEEEGSIILVSQNGMTLNMSRTDIPVQGRISSGVIAINLDEKDKVVLGSQVSPNNEIIVVTDQGYAKKVAVSEFEVMPRNRKGLRIINLSENGKKLIYSALYSSEELVAVETSKGLESITFRTMPCEQRYSKGTQKVKGKILFVSKYCK